VRSHDCFVENAKGLLIIVILTSSIGSKSPSLAHYVPIIVVVRLLQIYDADASGSFPCFLYASSRPDCTVPWCYSISWDVLSTASRRYRDGDVDAELEERVNSILSSLNIRSPVCLILSTMTSGSVSARWSSACIPPHTKPSTLDMVSTSCCLHLLKR
jgi:hypothetical protein